MKTVKEFLNAARAWLGKNEDDGSYHEILEAYNNHKPLAVGYPVKDTDDWCDAFVSAVAIKADCVDLIGTECGCERHIAIWRQKGIWHPGSITPRPGDIFALDWNGDHSGMADHVGIVEYVEGGVIHTIEGNRGGAVRRKEYPVGDSRFKGFACPAFSEHATVAEIAKEVIAGKWASGDERKKRLTAAGYNYDAVQAEVNRLMRPAKTVQEIAKEVIAGKWGSGADRKTRLTAAGYSYDEIQREVNRQMGA